MTKKELIYRYRGLNRYCGLDKKWILIKWGAYEKSGKTKKELLEYLKNDIVSTTYGYGDTSLLYESMEPLKIYKKNNDVYKIINLDNYKDNETIKELWNE